MKKLFFPIFVVGLVISVVASVSAAPVDLTPPAPPMEFHIVSATGNEITLSWSMNEEPDLMGYRIFAREIREPYDYAFPVWEGLMDNRPFPLNTDQNGNPWCLLSGFKHDSIFYFVVKAFDMSGNSSQNSNEVCWQVDPPPTVPLPGALWFLGSGLISLSVLRKRFRK